MQFIRQHWFGLITGIILFCFFVLFILVLLSPRQDEKKRGFIPCTETMAEQMLNCENRKFSCMLSAIIKNTWCDIKVVGFGIGQWARGRQNAPWSNYIFIPEHPIDENFDEAALTEYLQNNPPPQLEMRELQQLNEELEHEPDQLQPEPAEQPG